jgi:endonuclease/exonuclease/phosphatase family metal-dependent hydrolase
LVAAHLLGSATLGRPYWVASIHLDFARAKVRRKQVWDIIDRFSEADEPLVLLGDFNTSLTGREKTLHHLLEELKLHVHHPESREVTTFPLRSTRIDWIVLSEHLHFRSHAVLPDVLSDHSAVTAEIEIARHS